MQAKRSMLQINTADVGGGAAAVAFNLHLAYRARGYRSWMGVGAKHSDEPDVFVIPNDDSRHAWARAFQKYSDTLTPIVGHVRGADRARNILREFGSPRTAIQRRLGYEDFDFPGTWRLMSIVGETPDILHLHNLHGGYFDLRALPWLTDTVPTLVTLHDEWMLTGHCAYSFGCGRWESGCGICPDLNILPAVPRDATAPNWRRKRENYRLSRLVVVSPSEWLADRARRSILAEGATQTVVIPNGVDRKIFKPDDKLAARDRLRIDRELAVVVFAAKGIRENMFKDYPSIRKAVAALSSSLGAKRFDFIGVGDEGPSEQFANGSIRFVRHISNRETLADYYRAADVYMHAARAENFPNTVLEALSCGTPVVATAVGGIAEQIRSYSGQEGELNVINGVGLDEATGILVPAGDGEQLGKSASWLINHSQVLNSLAGNAAADAAKRFDLDRQTDDYLELYENMIAERRATPAIATGVAE